MEVAFARKTLSSPNSSLALAVDVESIPALTLAISDTNQPNLHLAQALNRHVGGKQP